MRIQMLNIQMRIQMHLHLLTSLVEILLNLVKTCKLRVWQEVCDETLVLKINGRWEVGLKNRREAGLVGDGLSQNGGWFPHE